MYLPDQKKNLFFKIVFSFSLFFLFPFGAQAASLILSPASGSYHVGDRVAVKVSVSSDTPFNAVSGVLSFPGDVLSVESVSKIGSALDFWVTEPIVSRSSNTIKFEGVALGGFSGTTGNVLVVNLKAIKDGVGKFNFQSGQILANDGQGTDITGAFGGATFTVLPAEIKEVPKVNPKPEIKEEPVPENQEVKQPKPSLQAPEIVFSSKYGNQSILGTSEYPSAQVLVTFLASDGGKVFIIGNSDKEGSFNLLIPKSLKHGTYNVSAVMIKSDKTNSENSNILIVTIGSIWEDVSVEVWSVIGMLIATVLYLFLRIYLHLKRDKNKNKDLRKDVKKMESVVHKSMDMLKEEVMEYDDKKTTLAEHKRLTSIKRDIDTAEKVIEKEFEDIE